MISKSEIDKAIRDNEFTFYDVNFGFLQAHKSFRPGCLHTFIGKSGQGKSTLMRSLLFQLLLGARVLLWVSEETEMNMQINLRRRFIPEDILKNLYVFPEIDYKSKNQNDILREIKLRQLEDNLEIIILDNLTTSFAYGDNIPQQSEFITKLKKLATDMNIPIVIFAHTRAGIPDNRLIDDEDIRGFKKISNMSDYFYAMQMFQLGEVKFQTIRTIKSRYHDQAIGSFYKLHYDSKIKAYDSDKKIPFEEFKVLFKARNKL